MYGYPTCLVVYFHLAECVLLHPRSFSGRQSMFRHVPCQFLVGKVCSAASRSISGRQSMFHHVPGRFLVATFQLNFRSAECVPPCPVLIFGWQSVFCRILDRFLNGKVHSIMSLSISGQQSVFHHVPSQFPVSRVCSAMSRVHF